MKPHLDISHEGTLGAEGRVKMLIDERSTAYIMSILTDLYSDPVTAVIREYSTNAWDSHQEAGITDPINVYLPTDLNPVFRVCDHGVGMDLERLIDTFSKYGASTKRETDNQTGMLGLGCKSALSYTSQFTLISVKDGMKHRVLVTREEDGSGALQVISSTPTDDPNGVEVQIPVVNSYMFKYKASEFYRFWQPGSVLVNDEPVETIWDRSDIVKLDDDIFMFREFTSSYIVMGNVPYKIDRDKVKIRLNVNGGVVARVDIGQVDFTPSREALHYTARTIDTVDTVNQFIKMRTIDEAQRLIDSAQTHKDAFLTYVQWKPLLDVVSGYGALDLRYKGTRIPIDFGIDEPGMLTYTISSYSDKSTRGHFLRMNEAFNERAMFVTGYPSNSLAATTKEKITQYLGDNDLKTKSIIYVLKQLPDKVWLQDVDQVDYETIKAVKLDKPERPVEIKRKYRYINWRGDTVKMDVIPDDVEVVAYMPALELQRTSIKESLVSGFLTKGQVVPIVLADDLKSFLKDYPGIFEFRTYFMMESIKFMGALTDLDKWHLSRQQHSKTPRTLPSERTVKKILDPDLREITELLKPVETNHFNILRRRMDSIIDLAKVFGNTVPAMRSECMERKLRVIRKRYPLASMMNLEGFHVQDSHILEYFNSTYIVRQGLHLHPATY